LFVNATKVYQNIISRSKRKKNEQYMKVTVINYTYFNKTKEKKIPTDNET